MKFAAISTVENIELSKLGSMNMCLAQHILGNDKYVDYFKKSDLFTIMDNGACEGAQVNVDELHEFAKLIHADEIVVGDVLYDGSATYNAMLEFFDKNKKVINMKYMGVAQGSTSEEWKKCFINMYENKNITTIGLSKLAVPKSFKEKTGTSDLMLNRLHVLNWIQEKGYILKPIHLLGLDEPFELMIAKRFKFVRSCDSCLPILCGNEDILFTNNNIQNIRPKKKFDFKESINNTKYSTIIDNVVMIESLAR